jgi:hypothetical protein
MSATDEQISTQTELCILHHRAKGNLWIDFSAVFRKWMRSAKGWGQLNAKPDKPAKSKPYYQKDDGENLDALLESMENIREHEAAMQLRREAEERARAERGRRQMQLLADIKANGWSYSWEDIGGASEMIVYGPDESRAREGAGMELETA